MPRVEMSDPNLFWCAGKIHVFGALIAFGTVVLRLFSFSLIPVQTVNEFAIFGLVALATLSAGWLYDRFGWITLNLAVAPLLAVALLSTAAIGRQLQLLEKPA